MYCQSLCGCVWPNYLSDQLSNCNFLSTKITIFLISFIFCILIFLSTRMSIAIVTSLFKYYIITFRVCQILILTWWCGGVMGQKWLKYDYIIHLCFLRKLIPTIYFYNMQGYRRNSNVYYLIWYQFCIYT